MESNEPQKPAHHHSGHQHQQLIDQLLHCAQHCEMNAAACLDDDNVTPVAHCIELSRDCADICILSARLLLRDSESAHQMLAECEAACRLCADECGKHEHEHCKRCAEACKNTAEACHAHHGQVNLK